MQKQIHWNFFSKCLFNFVSLVFVLFSNCVLHSQPLTASSRARVFIRPIESITLQNSESAFNKLFHSKEEFSKNELDYIVKHLDNKKIIAAGYTPSNNSPNSLSHDEFNETDIFVSIETLEFKDTSLFFTQETWKSRCSVEISFQYRDINNNLIKTVKSVVSTDYYFFHVKAMKACYEALRARMINELNKIDKFSHLERSVTLVIT